MLRRGRVLVRPPGAAAWCPRHQGNVAVIVVATEMILDRAAETFFAGWFERGRSTLKDVSRAGALRTGSRSYAAAAGTPRRRPTMVGGPSWACTPPRAVGRSGARAVGGVPAGPQS